jgi:hypothetical protein
MKKFFFAVNNDKSEIIESETYPIMLSQGGEWTSCTSGYNSKEELIEKCGIPETPCVECGNIFSTNYHDNEKMIERNMCFSCNLWTDRISAASKLNVMIVNHSMYTMGTETNEIFKYRGFGGRKFEFIKDNVRYESTNVWFGGKVPVHFRDRIKDNAIIDDGRKSVAINDAITKLRNDL